MMLTIHHLYDSRSERLLYAASALNIPHQVKAYARDATMLAPANYKELHPLGTAPVIEDGDIIIAESGAALIYMVEKYGAGKGTPAVGSKAYYECIELVHFIEGSLFPNLMTRMVMKMLGIDASVIAMMGERLKKPMEFMATTLGDKRYICGNDLSIADFMLAFTFDILQGVCFPGMFELDDWRDYTALNEYADRLRDNEHYRYSKRRDF